MTNDPPWSRSLSYLRCDRSSTRPSFFHAYLRMSQEIAGKSCYATIALNSISGISYGHTNANTSRPHHICRHCVHHCQLPQLVVICGQQPKAIWISAYKDWHIWTYGSRAFAVSGPTCWNALPPSLKSPSLKSAQFCSLLNTTIMAQPSLLFVTRSVRG